MEKKRRLAAMVMTALLFLTILFSYTFILENEGHECCDDECPICMEIEAAMQTISSLKAVLILPFSVAILCSFAHIDTVSYDTYCVKNTLISLKVELLD